MDIEISKNSEQIEYLMTIIEDDNEDFPAIQLSDIFTYFLDTQNWESDHSIAYYILGSNRKSKNSNNFN